MGIVVVYDVTDEASFNNVRNWMRNIEQHATDTVSNKVSARTAFRLAVLQAILPASGLTQKQISLHRVTHPPEIYCRELWLA